MPSHYFELELNGQQVASAPKLELLAGLVAQPRHPFNFTVREICPQLDNVAVRTKHVPEPKNHDIKREILGLDDQTTTLCPCVMVKKR